MYKISRGSLVVININEWSGHQPQESQLLVFIVIRSHGLQVTATVVSLISIGGYLSD